MKKQIEKITVEEAGELLGVHDNTVRDYCKTGKIKATKSLSGTWSIEKPSVEKFLNKFLESQKQTA